MHGARAHLALVLAAGGQLGARVDALGQLVVVVQDALEAQDVRDEVVGEDRQPVDVGIRDDAGQMEVVGGDLGALVEAAVGEERHRGQALRERLGAVAELDRRNAPRWLSASA